jgi:hypothetical protein
MSGELRYWEGIGNEWGSGKLVELPGVAEEEGFYSLSAKLDEGQMGYSWKKVLEAL